MRSSRSSETSRRLTDQANSPDERLIFSKPGYAGLLVVIAIVAAILLAGAIFILPQMSA